MHYLFLLLGFVLLTMSPPARAGEEPSSEELAVAATLFAEARTLERQDRYAEAEVKLRQVLKIKRTPGVLFHLAHCLERQGDLVGAMVHYERADDLIDNGMDAAEVRRLLAPKQEELSKIIPTISLSLPESVDAARVVITLDGKTMSSVVAGTPIPVNPGKHSLIVSTQGFLSFERVVEVTSDA